MYFMNYLESHSRKLIVLIFAAAIISDLTKLLVSYIHTNTDMCTIPVCTPVRRAPECSGWKEVLNGI